MKLSFSTRGWSALTFSEFVQTAEDMQFAGFELYDYYKFPAYSDKGGPLDPYAMMATMRSLRDGGIEIPNLDTSLDLGKEESLETMLKTVRMAGAMGVAFTAAEASCTGASAARSILTGSAAGLDAALVRGRFCLGFAAASSAGFSSFAEAVSGFTLSVDAAALVSVFLGRPRFFFSGDGFAASTLASASRMAYLRFSSSSFFVLISSPDAMVSRLSRDIALSSDKLCGIKSIVDKRGEANTSLSK